MKRYLLFFILGFGGISYADSETIDLKCTYIEGTKNVSPSSSYRQMFFKDESTILKINLKKQYVTFNDDSWKFLAISEGTTILINTRFLNLGNKPLSDTSETFRHWNEARIDRETGVLFLKNFSEQGKDSGNYKLALTKEYQCNSFKLKF